MSHVVSRARARSIVAWTGLGVIALTAGCTDSAGPATSAPPAASIPSIEGSELVVFAASSLAAAFDEIGSSFEQAHPGVIVTFNTGPSDGLAGQIQSEGTADVFASASTSWMDEVAADPGVSDRVDFVRNRLVLVTPPDNPAGIEALDDLTNEGVQLILAAASVPVGSYAREVLDNAGILDAALANLVSNEADAAALVQKMNAGEADAALVYESDIFSAAAGDELHAIEIPDRVNVIATYPIAAVKSADQVDLAVEFIDAVTGPAGQTTLARFGFEPILEPPASAETTAPASSATESSG